MTAEITAEKLFNKLKSVSLGGTTCLYTPEKCAEYAPLINRINALKKEKDVVILAHSYVSPEIIEGVADYVGDSYELSKRAIEHPAQTILFCAVKFMAETAKILNPHKTVYIPSELNGCSLAASINKDDMRALRAQYPDHTFVCYINTTADIITRIPNDNILFLPDKLMGQNVQKELTKRGVHKNIQLWDGTCYVHEEYEPDMIHIQRDKHKDLKVVSHPECTPSILKHSDFVGSTSQMVSYVKETKADAFLLLTECGLTSRLQTEVPEKSFIGSCTMCKYMKSNTLANICRVLETPTPNDLITLDPEIQTQAKVCIDEMFRYTQSQAVSV